MAADRFGFACNISAVVLNLQTFGGGAFFFFSRVGVDEFASRRTPPSVAIGKDTLELSYRVRFFEKNLPG